MKDLKVLDVYNNTDEAKVDSFAKSLDSSLEVIHDYDEYSYDDEWVKLFEEGVVYIDNILRNPNRFIANEEEVVKIELARRITVESIKHLSKNTNFIQDFDEETGDVRPSKILNINKEENFNTYENRFIYSLIVNMDMYLNTQKRFINLDADNRNKKNMSYTGSSKFDGEEVNVSVNFEANQDNRQKKDSELANLAVRIKKIEDYIMEFKSSNLFQTLKKLNVAQVQSPIKRTNVILKNVNFQYAVKLWNYMQNNVSDMSKTNKGKDVLKDDVGLKEMIDETFMLNYLVVNSMNQKEMSPERAKVVTKKIVTNLVQKVVSTNNNITKEELSDLVEKEFVVISNKDLADEDSIKKVFKTAINNYVESIKELNLIEDENEESGDDVSEQ